MVNNDPIYSLEDVRRIASTGIIDIVNDRAFNYLDSLRRVCPETHRQLWMESSHGPPTEDIGKLLAGLQPEDFLRSITRCLAKVPHRLVDVDSYCIAWDETNSKRYPTKFQNDVYYVKLAILHESTGERLVVVSFHRSS